MLDAGPVSQANINHYTMGERLVFPVIVRQGLHISALIIIYIYHAQKNEMKTVYPSRQKPMWLWYWNLYWAIDAEIFLYKWVFFIWNYHKCLSWLFPLRLHTYVMGLPPLFFLVFLVRGPSLDVRFWSLKTVPALKRLKRKLNSLNRWNDSYLFIMRPNIFKSWCLNAHFVPNNSHLTG